MSMFGFQSPEEAMAWLHRTLMVEQAQADREPVKLEVGDCWLRVVDFVPEIVVMFGEVDAIDIPGFVHGPVHSELDTEGRPTDTPVKHILMAITKEEFEAARQAEWQLMPLMLEGYEFASKVMSMAGLEPDIDELPEGP